MHFYPAAMTARFLSSIPRVDAPTLIAEQKNKWIDHVAGSAEGEFRAYSAGKLVYLLDADGNELGSPRELPSSAGGLAFSPNGKRLAASHYNGISSMLD